MSPDPFWHRPQDIPNFKSTLLSNLALLDLDLDPDYRTFPAECFTGKDTLARQKSRQAYFDWVFFNLYQIWDSLACQNQLKPYFPNLEPVQTVNLHTAFFHCLNILKTQGVFAKDIFFRKGIFDEGKSQKLLQILANFSDAVLRKVFVTGASPTSDGICKVLAASTSNESDVACVLPLIITYRYSLKGILDRREQLHERYRNFSCNLAQKDRGLDEQFAEIVKVQTFLDENTASDGNIARIAKAFNTHWQGDSELVSIIATGDDRPHKDVLLDREFSEVYADVRDDQLMQPLECCEAGYLDKLEERVNIQRNRLQEWKALKSRIEDSKIPGIASRSRLIVPTHKNLQSPRPAKVTPSGKDLVFSPRKSPRKSVWPVPRNAVGDMSLTQDESREVGVKSFQSLEGSVLEEPHAQVTMRTTDALQIGSSLDMAAFDAEQAHHAYLPAVQSPDFSSTPRRSALVINGVERGIDTASPRHEPSKYDANQPKSTLLDIESASPTRITTQTLSPQDELAALQSTPPRKTTLLERTRQSMLLVPAQTSKPRNSFQTVSPKTPQGTFDHDGSPWTNAALLDLSAEQDSVFKSRPKIAQSPPSSPLAFRSGVMIDHGH